jgi:hypothetical protein
VFFSVLAYGTQIFTLVWLHSIFTFKYSAFKRNWFFRTGYDSLTGFFGIVTIVAVTQVISNKFLFDFCMSLRRFGGHLRRDIFFNI